MGVAVVYDFDVVCDDDVGAGAGELSEETDRFDAGALVRLGGAGVEADFAVALAVFWRQMFKPRDVVDEPQGEG